MQPIRWAVVAVFCATSTGQAKTIKICFEAENAIAVKPALIKVMPGKKPAFSGRGFISIPPAAPLGVGSATYKINVAAPGPYYVFARTYYAPGSGNSISLILNGRTRILGEDGNYSKWHWITHETPVRLKRGMNTIVLANREAGVLIDQIFLTNDSEYTPTKIRTPTHDGSSGKPIAVIPKITLLPM